MTLAQGRVIPQQKLTSDYLLDTPLPRLLADLQVDLQEHQPSPDFPPCGYAVVSRGRIGLRLPAGQNRWERDMIARSMLGDALRVPMPPLPAPYQLSELPSAPQEMAHA